MEFSSFIKQYIKNPRTVGAIAPSSDKLACKMVEDVLKNEGEFITFQYTLFKMKLFKTYFRKIKRKKVIFNLPPAYVLRCKNK